MWGLRNLESGLNFIQSFYYHLDLTPKWSTCTEPIIYYGKLSITKVDWVINHLSSLTSVVDVWDWEITVRVREIRKSLYEKLKFLYENEKISCEIIITNREWKTAMCRQWKIVVWEKESLFEIIDCFFSEPVRHNQSAESILAGFSLILNGRDCQW